MTNNAKTRFFIRYTDLSKELRIKYVVQIIFIHFITIVTPAGIRSACRQVCRNDHSLCGGALMLSETSSFAAGWFAVGWFCVGRVSGVVSGSVACAVTLTGMESFPSALVFAEAPALFRLFLKGANFNRSAADLCAVHPVQHIFHRIRRDRHNGIVVIYLEV